MEIGTKEKMWIFGLILLFCIGIAAIVSGKLTAKNYDQLIRDKDNEIIELREKADEFEKKMQMYKKQAKYLAQEIVKSSDRIKAIKEDIERKKELTIAAPETTEETVRRLKEAGFEPIVDCK